jgi:hypothetical protein
MYVRRSGDWSSDVCSSDLARDGWINVEGAAADIERAKSLFTELHQAVSRGTPIRRQEFSRAVSAI